MPERTCVEDGCDRTHYGRGWCRLHYGRAWHGKRLDERPRELVAPGADLDARLRHHGWTVTPAGCWEWASGLNGSGYGQLAVGADRPMIASRAAYAAWVGPIPDGQVVCHRCDNPPCINPLHLFLGGRLENNRDALAKQRIANGTRSPNHRLTDEQVEDIRRRYAAGGVTQRALAAEHGVCQQLVSSIVRGRKRRDRTYPSISPATGGGTTVQDAARAA